MERDDLEKLMVVLKEQREYQKKTYKWINFWSIFNICIYALGLLILFANIDKF